MNEENVIPINLQAAKLLMSSPWYFKAPPEIKKAIIENRTEIRFVGSFFSPPPDHVPSRIGEAIHTGIVIGYSRPAKKVPKIDSYGKRKLIPNGHMWWVLTPKGRVRECRNESINKLKRSREEFDDFCDEWDPNPLNKLW